MGKLIVKDNVLIEASHRLGEVEQRLILLAILEARNECKTVEQLQGKELIIHADDYAKIFKISKDMAYKALRKAVVGLFEAKWGYKYLTDKGEKRIRYERFIQSADYGEGDGIVKFMFSNAIIPMLIELEKRFTVYEVEQVAQLSSSYSMRLYEFFMQHFDKKVGKGWLEISLIDLRFRFGVLPTEYKRMCDFKKYVLDRSVKQINARTDLTVSYQQRKCGRTIVSFRFDFKAKSKLVSKPKHLKKRVMNTSHPMTKLADGEAAVIMERIEAHIAQLEGKGKIVSHFHRANITKKAIKEQWGLDEYHAKQVIEQEQQERRHKEALKRQKAKEEEKYRWEEENARIERFSVIWESLNAQEQKALLEEVEKRYVGTPFEPFFKKSCKEGTAHTNPMFFFWFFKILGI